MNSSPDNLKDLSGRGLFPSAGAAFTFYGAAMLGVALFAQPLEAVDVHRNVPAAHAAVHGPLAQATLEQDAPAKREQTVYRPETLPPATGNVSFPVDRP